MFRFSNTKLRSSSSFQFDQDLFWNWCTERGVTSRPLKITQALSTSSSSVLLRCLVPTERITNRGSIIAAIPYSPRHDLSSRASRDKNIDSSSSSSSLPSFRFSGILNAETVPLGLVPHSLPLPEDICDIWQRKKFVNKKKFSKLSRKNNNRKSSNSSENEESIIIEKYHRNYLKYSQLLSTFGDEERRFLWLAGVVASAVANNNNLLYQHYGPYFDLLFSSSTCFDDLFLKTPQSQKYFQLLKKQNSSFEKEFQQLVALHQVASESCSLIMQQEAKRSLLMSGSGKNNSNKNNIRVVNFEDVLNNISTAASCEKKQEEQQQEENDSDSSSCLNIPSPSLFNACLRLVLSRSISFPLGLENNDNNNSNNNDGDFENNSNQHTAKTTSSSCTLGNSYRILKTKKKKNSEQKQDFLIPSLVPIVDMLNHPFLASSSASENSVVEPNCEVITAESPVDGVRRVIIVSLKPIEVNEPLTVNYNLLGEDYEDEKEPKQKKDKKDILSFEKALTFFRFGFC